MEPITIPSLGNTQGHDLADDRRLPNEMFEVLFLRTQPFGEGKRFPFISFQKNKSSDISKNTISGWIRSLLYSVYTNPTKMRLHSWVDLLMPSMPWQPH